MGLPLQKITQVTLIRKSPGPEFTARASLAPISGAAGGDYRRRAIQRSETRTSSRTVPQIIPVATTIAVGKLIKGPPFQATLHTDRGYSRFRPNRDLRQTSPLPRKACLLASRTVCALSTPVDKVVEKSPGEPPQGPHRALLRRAISSPARAPVIPVHKLEISPKIARAELWISV